MKHAGGDDEKRLSYEKRELYVAFQRRSYVTADVCGEAFSSRPFILDIGWGSIYYEQILRVHLSVYITLIEPNGKVTSPGAEAASNRACF